VGVWRRVQAAQNLPAVLVLPSRSLT
jgi:hypothetical protein